MVSHLKALSMTTWYSAMPSTRASTELSSRLTSRGASLQSGLCNRSFSACSKPASAEGGVPGYQGRLQGRQPAHHLLAASLCMQQMVTCLLTDPDASGSACANDCTSMVCSCCSLRPWAVVAAAVVAGNDACSHACSQSSMHCSVRGEWLQDKRHSLLRAAAMAVAKTRAQRSLLLYALPEGTLCLWLRETQWLSLGLPSAEVVPMFGQRS